MDQNATEKILSEYSIQSTNTYSCDTLEQLLEYTQDTTGPYILKISGKHLAHKTEIGGVIGPVSSPSEITTAHQALESNIEKHLSEKENYQITI